MPQDLQILKGSKYYNGQGTFSGMSMANQKLYKLDYDRKCSRLVVRSYEDNMALLHQYHGSPTSGHCGLNATFEKMSQDYYWRNMTQDIKHYIATCTCQPLRRQPSEMCLMKIKEPWKLTGVNLMGEN
ncbi:Gypsy retrotransposon integrase-like protein 1 [Portunus trituberculatus]|uniref:Gypsy retrotransposon integrase-like protein 1 n=1 Tax=Portunus trituberculatus TaxID=210409 RepID=A0A5B7DJA6_PORTR|nr:Gypsy retrotransposon integrase-like protein 1 [Portunus trituberculatus]